MNLAHILSEQQRTGRRIKPNRNNPVTKERIETERRIKREAQNTNIPEHEIALDFVTQSIGDLQRFVVSKGEQPLQNPVELSVQVAALREKDIADIQRALSTDREEAQIWLEQFEQAANEGGSAEADNFIGSVIGAVGAVAAKGIDKIRDARLAKGKPTKFWDFLSKNTGGKASLDYSAQPSQPSGIAVLAGDVLNEIERRETKKKINEMLPLIIGGVVVLILVTVLITSNAAKNK